VGSHQKVTLDVRVIAATNRDLEAEYRAGRFRRDLFFRLNVVAVHLPPLREHRSDIPMLVQWFLNRYAPGSEIQVTSAAMDALVRYDWPGNVRELENAIERATALGNGRLIDIGDLPPAVVASSPIFEPASVAPAFAPLTTDLEDIERATIQRVFAQVRGDKVVARKLLGISRATLYRKLKRYNIGLRPEIPGGTQGLH
jgi:DNA-binding NtrC family response regulator